MFYNLFKTIRSFFKAKQHISRITKIPFLQYKLYMKAISKKLNRIYAENSHTMNDDKKHCCTEVSNFPIFLCTKGLKFCCTGKNTLMFTSHALENLKFPSASCTFL